MTEEKKRVTFDPKNLKVLVAEAMRTVNEFAKAVRRDFGKMTHLDVLEQISDLFVDYDPIDIASFRLGMYAVIIEQERRRHEDLRAAAGMRYIV